MKHLKPKILLWWYVYCNFRSNSSMGHMGALEKKMKTNTLFLRSWRLLSYIVIILLKKVVKEHNLEMILISVYIFVLLYNCSTVLILAIMFIASFLSHSNSNTNWKNWHSPQKYGSPDHSPPPLHDLS